jgi:hypothetical protein
MITYVPLARWVAPVVPIEPPLADLDRIGFLPLADGEVLLSAHYYPLAVRLDGPAPVIGALVRRDLLGRGLTGANGQWLGAYTPLSLRCFPLRLAGAPSADPLADFEIANLPRGDTKPKVVRIRDDKGAPTKELLAIHEGLKSVWDGQQKMRPGLDLLLVADLLVPILERGPEKRPSQFHTVDRRRYVQFSKFTLEAMTRGSFGAVDLATALTFSQAHLHAEVRPAHVPLPATGETLITAADAALAAGIDTITPWLDTSELFPGAWAADASIWQASASAAPAAPDAKISAPAST